MVGSSLWGSLRKYFKWSACVGSGKMIIAYYGILVMEKILEVEDGVGLGCQPLSALMEEKLKTSPITTGFISMTGDLKHSLDDDCSISKPLDSFKNGDIKCILGHPESFLSETAKEILNHLQQKGKIVFTFIDECQMNLSNHWGEDFRPHMKTVPGQLRGKAVKTSPCLAMSATCSLSEIEDLKVSLGFRDANTVVLKSNPVQSQICYVKVRRPPNVNGSFGWEEDGKTKHGLIHTLDRIVLDKYVDCVKQGKKPKKTIIFFRKEDDIANIYDYLCERLPDEAAHPQTTPWVQNHSGIGPVTAESIRQRRDSISLYLTTSVMLLGLDFDDVDIVVMVRPFNFCHYLVQAAGRGGRKMLGGMRKKVLFYLLFNSSDVSNNVPGLSTAVREFCLTDSCLKEFLSTYFGFTSAASAAPAASGWCCSNCISME